jgi:hypothetical protein
MTDAELQQLRFPIGKFVKPEHISADERAQMIQILDEFPERLRKLTESLSNEQLDTQYRPEGWTVRQVVHHCADSHMNCIIRVKLLLTEDKPVIKPYPEQLFAELHDSKNFPIQPSLQLLEGVHLKLVALLRSCSVSDFARAYIHPQYNQEYTLDQVLALYSWHCNHHYAHIESLLLRKSWLKK